MRRRPSRSIFPTWNQSWPARAIRRASLPTWILPLARVFAWLHVEGREHLDALQGPVIFAANHQSHMDTPVILAALPPRWRYRTATAMAKEFFKAHFFPEQYGRAAWFTNSLNYYLAALFFNAFPIPQREAGARQTLRYIGDLVAHDWSVLIFPEGRRSDAGEIGRFMPGIGMIASRLGVPVVPVRIVGLDKVLHPTWRMARPGRVRVIIWKACASQRRRLRRAGKAGGARYGIWIKPCRCSDGLCPMTHGGGRHEISDGRTAARSVTRRRRLRGHERTRLRAHWTAATSKGSRSRFARTRLRLAPRLLPLRTWRVRLGRRTIRAPATRPRPLGAWALAARSPRLVLSSRDTGGKTSRSH